MSAGPHADPGLPLDPMLDGSGALAEQPAAQAPDTRGLDERFPDPVPSASPATATRLSSTDRLEPDAYARSLVYSGVLGLAISLIGLSMMARRRRTW